MDEDALAALGQIVERADHRAFEAVLFEGGLVDLGADRDSRCAPRFRGELLVKPDRYDALFGDFANGLLRRP